MRVTTRPSGTERFAADREHPAEVPHRRVRLRLRADHEAGGVAQRDDRQPERVAELQEPGGLVRGVVVDRSPEMGRVVRDQPHRPALDPDQRGDHARGEPARAAPAPTRRRRDRRRPRGRRRPGPGSRARRGAAAAGRAPPSRRPAPGSTTRYCRATRVASSSSATRTSTTPLATCTDIGPTSSGATTPSPPPSIIAGPPIPRLAPSTAMITSHSPASAALPAKQRPGDDRDQRHPRREPREDLEGRDVEHRGPAAVGVARPPATALGVDHDRPAALLGDLERPVLLLVVDGAPGCRRARCSRRRARRRARARRRPAPR